MPHIPPHIPGTPVNDLDARERIWSMIREINTALLVTQDSFGHFHARPMETQRRDKETRAFTGELWFLTRDDSIKVNNIRENPDVLVSYAEPHSQNYISIAGTAEIIRNTDKVREFWHEPFRQWFPDGPDDPHIALIRIQAETAEYWDAPTRSVIYAYGYFKQNLHESLAADMPSAAERRSERWQNEMSN